MLIKSVREGLVGDQEGREGGGISEDDVVHIKGGLLAWGARVDAEFPVY